MKSRATLGAVIGLWLGLLAILVLILWPRRDGDFYEVGDPLVYLGLPVLVVLLGTGALIGAATGLRESHDGLGARARTITAVSGSLGVVLAVGLYVWGVG